MLDRLVEYTYSAFDRNPNAQIAFRARHADGLSWRVSDRHLMASTELGAALLSIPLRGKTIAQVIDALEDAGCTIVYRDSVLQHRAADALLSGAAISAQHNGDSFRVYDSLLWSIMDAYATVLEDADIDIDTAIRMLYLGTAEDFWLDEWGGYFGLPREDWESDTAYRVRIIVETLRPRVNRFAIEKAIYDLTTKEVEIYEPWVDMFVLSQSNMDDRFHMQDGTYYTYNIIHPRSRVPLNWTKPLAIIDRNRPAGTLVAEPEYAPMYPVFSYELQHQHAIMRRDLFSTFGEYVDTAALDFALAMSNYEVMWNPVFNVYNMLSMMNVDGVNEDHTIDMQYIPRAAMLLSGGDPMGHENAIFGHSQHVVTFNSIELSGNEDLDGYSLSNVLRTATTVLHDQVFVDLRGSTVENAAASTAQVNITNVLSVYGERIVPTKPWQGAWDDRNWRSEVFGINIISTPAP